MSGPVAETDLVGGVTSHREALVYSVRDPAGGVISRREALVYSVRDPVGGVISRRQGLEPVSADVPREARRM